MKKRISLLLVLVMVSLLFASCGGSSSKDALAEVAYETEEEATYAEEDNFFEAVTAEPQDGEYSEDYDGEDSNGQTSPAITQISAAVDRKIVRNLRVQLQTEEYDNGLNTMDKLTHQFGGYYASSQIESSGKDYENYARTSYYQVKIPSDQIDAFIEGLKGSFIVDSMEESAEDITRSYYDNEASIKALEERVKRLETLLEQGKDLKYILEIEREIANTVQEISILHSRQEVMKNQVNMGTIDITLQEIVEYKPIPNETTPSYSVELRRAFYTAIYGFTDTLRTFSLFVVRNFPLLIFLSIVIVVAIRFIRRYNKRKKEQRAVKKSIVERVQAAATKQQDNSSHQKGAEAEHEINKTVDAVFEELEQERTEEQTDDLPANNTTDTPPEKQPKNNKKEH